MPACGVVVVAQGIVELLDICWFELLPRRASTDFRVKPEVVERVIAG
jgi:hypothetical protein